MAFRSNNQHLYNNFPSRLSIIPARITEMDESSLDSSTVPTYEEFTVKTPVKNVYKKSNNYLNSTELPEMTCILTDDEDEESFENKPPEPVFKKPTLPLMSNHEPSIIEIDSITSTFSSIDINKKSSEPAKKVSNPVFTNILNTQRTPNKTNAIEIDFDSVKLFRDKDVLTKKVDTPICPRVKIPTWDTILSSDTPINKKNIPPNTKDSSKLVTPKKNPETPNKSIKNPLSDVTPRSQIKASYKMYTPSKALGSPVPKSASKARKIPLLQSSTSNSEMSSNSFEESCEYVQVAFQGTQTNFTPNTPMVKRRSPSLIIMDDSVAGNDSMVQSQGTIDMGTSAFYPQGANDDMETSLSQSQGMKDMGTSVFQSQRLVDMGTSVYQSQGAYDTGTSVYQSQETKEMGTSVYQSQRHVDMGTSVYQSQTSNDMGTSVYQSQRTTDMGTSVYQSQGACDMGTSAYQSQIHDESKSHTSSITKNFKTILETSSDESEEDSVPATVNVTMRKSAKKPGRLETSLTKAKPNKKRVSMCGEGLSKAQLKIDETILDESENESDFRNGRIFTLHGSRIEEDLSSDENRMLKETQPTTGAQIILDSCEEDDLPEQRKTKETDSSDAASNKARQTNRNRNKKVSSEDTSDDKYEQFLKDVKVKNTAKRNCSSEETSDDKFEEFLKTTRPVQSKPKISPKTSMKGFIVRDSEVSESRSSSSEDTKAKKQSTARKSKKSASKVLAEDSMSNSSFGHSDSESDSDNDGQLFHVKVTNKLLNEEQNNKKKVAAPKASKPVVKSTILDSSSSSSSSDVSDEEESVLELSDSPAPRRTTSTDSDSSDDEISRKFREKNLKFKTSILSGTSNVFQTPTLNKNREQMVSRLTKTVQVTRVKESSKLSFIESLSIQVENESVRDPAVAPYLKKFKNKTVKNDLLQECFKRFNEAAFDNRLPKDMKLSWSSRLTATGGFCKNNLRLNTSEIQISTKVCDTAERMRDVLAHEMCHAAAFLLDQVLDGHGSYWRAWANKVNFAFRKIPKITVTHSYEIKKKFIFKCMKCGYEIHRFSKSIDITKQGCGICHGRFQILQNKPENAQAISDLTKRTNDDRFDRAAGNGQSSSAAVPVVATPSKPLNAFSQFVKDNYGTVKNDKGLSHAETMKELGAQFKLLKA